ncbi:GPP34 family phosphoprotein [Nonomuraea sp. NPDC048892]|uniref:GPP34 family phosphoprotein n=1 Tax=Nonomuraea sp. NPDC048892 TaxID=3154624 RepID=UPI0033D86324
MTALATDQPGEAPPRPAGVIVLSAWQPGDDGLIAWIALWAAAAYLGWKGLRAFAGRSVRPARAGPVEPDAAPPSVLVEVGETVKGAGLFMARVVVVLVLLLLIPTTLGAFVKGVMSLFDGDLLTAGFAFLAAGWLGWYAWGPLRELWKGDESSTTGEDRAAVDSGPVGGARPVPEGTVLAPPRLSLPEAFLLLSYRYGDVHDRHQSAVACAAAELGELALRRRLRVVPRKKIRVFGFECYLSPSKIHLLDATPTGLAWADELLAELETAARQRGGTATDSRREPISLRQWLKRRGDRALLLHRDALTGGGVLFHSPGSGPDQEERHHPDPGVRDALASRLRAATEERVPMDGHLLLLSDLVEEAGLNGELGLTMTMRQRLDRARGIGAVAALPEEVRDTSAVLSMSVPSRSHDSASSEGGGGE